MHGRLAVETVAYSRQLPEIQAIWADRVKEKIVYETIYAMHAHPRRPPRSGHPHPDLADCAPFAPPPVAVQPEMREYSAQALMLGYHILGGESRYMPTPNTDPCTRYAAGGSDEWTSDACQPATSVLASRAVRKYALVNAAFLQLANDVAGIRFPPPSSEVLSSIITDLAAYELTYIQWHRIVQSLNVYTEHAPSMDTPQEGYRSHRCGPDQLGAVPVLQAQRLHSLHRLLFHTVPVMPWPAAPDADGVRCLECDDGSPPPWHAPARRPLPCAQCTSSTMPPQCQSIDVLMVLFEYIFDMSWPTCAREDCPCTSTCNGLPGTYCCITCRYGEPCSDNWHPTPKVPPDPLRHPAVAAVCKAWRDAWDAKCEAWVCAPYPSAAYFLQRCFASADPAAEMVGIV